MTTEAVIVEQCPICERKITDQEYVVNWGSCAPCFDANYAAYLAGQTVAVNDDDRNAAVDLAHALGMSAEDFTSGQGDLLVQALAKRRLSASSRPPPDREEVAQLIREKHSTHTRYKPAAKTAATFHSGDLDAADAILEMIGAGK